MKRIGVEGVKLTEYEMNIASHLVDPQTMKVTVHLLMMLTLEMFGQFFFIGLCWTSFFTLLYLPAGDLERYSWSG